MEEKRKTVDTRQLMDAYRELLPQVETLPLEITGSSMTPFLVEGRDTVYLRAVRGPLRVGDIILYQRDSGAYILHRICRVEKDSFCCVGDAHTVVERHIRPGQVIAVADHAERKGRRQAPGTFWWTFFAKIWVRMIPLRPLIMKAYSAARRIF